MTLKLSFSLLLLGCFSAFAQQTDADNDGEQTIPLIHNSENKSFRFDMTSLNRPKVVNPLSVENGARKHNKF